MFDGLAKAFSEEMLSLSKGQLQCLPYSRALLDFFTARGKTATPLVVRVVIFGKQTAIDWNELTASVPGIVGTLFRGASESEHANGTLEVEIPPIGTAAARTVHLPYRTLGFPHGAAALGSYHTDGSWNGHLVVCVDSTLIDLTIGQINDPRFGINFTPPYVTIETDAGFISGSNPLIGIQDGMLVIYRAYPDERTYEQSNSWGTDPRFRQQLLDFGKRFADRVKSISDSELQGEHLTPGTHSIDASPSAARVQGQSSARRKLSPKERAEVRKKQKKGKGK